MFSKGRAGYVVKRSTTYTRPSKNTFFVFVSLVLAFTFLATTVASAVLPTPGNVALADDPEDILRDVINDSGVDSSEDGFSEMLRQVEEGPEEGTFSYVFHRLFSIGYMNNTEDGVAASPHSDRDWNCDVGHEHAGTPLYHNCDVPNIITEFMQDIAEYLPSGPQNATSESAKVPFGLGLPSTLPGTTGVPVDPAERTIKYTGLELFGYNMKYTSYRGEWDHVKVLTSARALSNFGFMDGLRVGASVIVNGIVTGVGQGASNFVDGLSQGNIVGAIGGFFTGFFSGAFAGGVKTIMDTSDLNVFNTYAWYRVNYGATVYGGRELSQRELSALMLRSLYGLFNNDHGLADLPENYLAIQEGPEEPLQPISLCVAQREDMHEDGTPFYVPVVIPSSAPGGISEGDCFAEAMALYDDPAPEWTEDGNRQLETLADWKDRNVSVFSAASTYGITCDIDDSTEENRENRLADFYACWATEWSAMADQVMRDAQAEANQSWFDGKLGIDNVFNFFANEPEWNFNAPWSRFVCTDENGDDVTPAESFPTFVYNPDGSLNSDPNCTALRPPVQNGFFGNGYPAGSQPPIDTRAEMRPDWGVASLLLNPTVFIDPSIVANAGLGVAKFTTQISNEIIDLAFNPILQSLGLDTKIITWIEAFRESIYFPLITLLVALAGLQILFQAGRTREYSKSFINIVLVMGTYVVGAALLLAPASVLRAVDEIPADVETAVMGTIFMAGGGSDGLCYASQDGTPEEGLDGTALPFSPRAATRMMECEVWRVFAFNPWVKGQFGAPYEHLYANGSGMPNTLQNTNGSLVGNARVEMGAGHSINNWALYQLDVLSVGTSTTEDVTEPTGVIPRDFYRIVDAQAGPNNGAASDGTYLSEWSGQDAAGRTVVGLTSAVVAIFGLVAIFVFAIVKIEITLFTALLLLFMPIVFLIGLHPTVGRLKLRQYVGTIVALMFQRVILVMLLAIMLKVLTAVALSTGEYWLSAAFSAVICVLFIKLRKPVLGFFNSAVGSATGGLMGQNHLNDYGRSAVMSAAPTSVRNYGSLQSAAMTGAVGGFIGGYIHSGREGASKGWKEARELQRGRMHTTLRRKGLGDITKLHEATQAGIKASGAPSKELRQKNLDKVKTKAEKTVSGLAEKEVSLNMRDRATRTSVNRLSEIQDEINAKNAEWKALGVNDVNSSRRRRKPRPSGDQPKSFSQVEREQLALVKERKGIKDEISALETERDTIMQRLYALESDDFEGVQEEKLEDLRASGVLETPDYDALYEEEHEAWEKRELDRLTKNMEKHFKDYDRKEVWDSASEDERLQWMGWKRQTDPDSKDLVIKDDTVAQKADEAYQEFVEYTVKNDQLFDRAEPEPVYEDVVRGYEVSRKKDDLEIQDMSDIERYRYELRRMRQDLTDARIAAGEAVHEKVAPVAQKGKERFVDPLAEDVRKLKEDIAPAVDKVDRATKPVQKAAKAVGNKAYEGWRNVTETEDRPKWGDSEKDDKEYDEMMKRRRQENEE